MKQMKRTGIYQCSNYNCTFDPKGVRTQATLAENFLDAEEQLCNAFLSEMAKRDERNERAKVRREEKRAAELVTFKANVEKITFADVLELRASKQVSL